MKSIAVGIGVTGAVFGTILLAFGNSIGIIPIFLGILCAIANK